MAEKQKSRLDWTDMDWAVYFGCPVQEIPEYRKFLNENYLPAIEYNKTTGKYSFAMYRYDIAPSGHKRLRLWLTDDKHSFVKKEDALHDANNVISTLEFTDFWAKTYKVPKQVLQMLLMCEK